MTSAPYEEKIALGIKINTEESSTKDLYNDFQIGDLVEVSEPKGRFTLVSKPHEFRTIIGFAGGIGITPVSYTHLDVYKRQLHKLLEELFVFQLSSRFC